MNLVEFLEARIDEQEAGLQGRTFADDPSTDSAGDSIGIPLRLTEALLAECAMKRRLLDDWRAAAAVDGITDPADAVGPVALARRSMLLILAGGYKDHPDYEEEWALRSEASSYSGPEAGPSSNAKTPRHRVGGDGSKGILDSKFDGSPRAVSSR